MKKYLKQILAAVVVLAMIIAAVPEGMISSAKAETPSYVRIARDTVHLRPSPGTSDYVERLVRDTVCQVTGETTYKGKTWYKLTVPKGKTYRSDLKGYIDTEYLTAMTAEEVTAWKNSGAPTVYGTSVATPTPNPKEPDVGTPVTGQGKIKGGANFRSYPDVKDSTNIISFLNADVIVDLLQKPSVIDDDHWYKVKYNGKIGYVNSKYITLITSAPTAVPESSFNNGTVTTIKVNVNLRLKAGGSGDTILQIPSKGTTLPVKAGIVETKGYKWYYVEYKGSRGYVRGDCVKYTAPSTGAVTAAPAPTVTTAPSTTYGSYVKTIKPGVNVRKSPMGASITQISKNQIMPILAVPVKNGGYTWYLVRTANGIMGYVRGDCVTECDASGGKGTSTPTATTAPSQTTTGQYIKITKKPTVNLRNAAGGETIDTVKYGDVLQLGSAVVTNAKGYSWYYISDSGKKGYIRNDCCFVLSDEQTKEYLSGKLPATATKEPGATSAPSQTTIKVVQIINKDGNKVNLREAPTKDSKSDCQVASGTVMSYTETSTVGGITWYHVSYNGKMLWVMGTYVKVLTQAEYDAYVAQNPAGSVIKGYVKTIKGGVNLRAGANSSKKIGQVAKNKIFAYYAEPITAGGYKWYYVSTTLGYGYLRSDCLMLCDEKGNKVTAPTGGTGTGTTGDSGYVKYETLRRGSTGPEVLKMVTKLKEIGYFTGTVTSEFTTAVETAVKDFQRARGLTVDGLAGQKTLSALYGTSSVTTGLYPAEKVDWFKGDIQKVFPRRAIASVYDVKTGLTFTVRRWAGGSHADVEPLTKADTEVMCKIYNTKKASDINSSEHYQRRPILVTIGSRTFAASMYGVPHNYPDGDTIPDNGFDGQFCIHFVNSKTHNSGAVDTGHQEAIDYAWNHCPAGKK